ncbi:glycosyltransferase family 9 protein [Rhodocytophaga rosea]|uniref:Glycosyltransferase family 9 protein n=1 Tax=Rhodocytophaga rosea TaxID=2704465 RepID=A0A6C0GP52_9BACT|nr:glycosyltransferase family 9 protein [Rhodocytophaga rosea]QHT69634.1 glycosyltransferase family 9 protein [Rhodocytophaga rosea]
MLQIRYLLLINRLLQIPYNMLWYVHIRLRRFVNIEQREDNRAVVLKFMGMGSIIRIASIWEKTGVDFESIAFCTFMQNKEICELLGFKQVIYIRTGSITHFITDTYLAIVSIRAFRPNYIIDLERCSAAIGILRIVCAWISGCKTIALDRKLTEGIHDIVLSLEKLTYGAAIEKTGAMLNKEQNLNNEPAAYQEAEVDAHKILVNINASTYLPQRKYPAAQFIDLLRSLQTRAKNNAYQFYLTGSADEYAYVQRVVEKLQQHRIMAYNVAGKWSLNQLVQQLSSCRLFITNDSGPMHLSVYMHIPTIALWGPTHYRYFGYENDAFARHVSLNKSCSPCFTDPASEAAIACQGKISCMQEISPEWIAGQAETWMKQHTSAYRTYKVPKGLLQSESEKNLLLH